LPSVWVGIRGLSCEIVWSCKANVTKCNVGACWDWGLLIR
jgi:hypothetical protein